MTTLTTFHSLTVYLHEVLHTTPMADTVLIRVQEDHRVLTHSRCPEIGLRLKLTEDEMTAMTTVITTDMMTTTMTTATIDEMTAAMIAAKTAKRLRNQLESRSMMPKKMPSILLMR